MRIFRFVGLACAFGLVLAWPAARAQPAGLLLSANAVQRVSPHVYVMMGFPNVAIVVGDRAVLAVDTGLGARNGAIVGEAARKLSTKGQVLYLTTTHFHPEHASGQGGMPPGTRVVRNRAQQAELESDGQRMMTLFSDRSADMKALLQGATIGRADIVYDTEHTLDLGGVQARLFAFGPAHTLGDQVVFVPEDSVLISGDVVQNRLSPNILCARCSPRQWIAVLDRIAPLKPQHVVPDHGPLGGGELVAQERAFLQDLQTRAMALKAEGVAPDEAGRRIAAEFQAKYVGWSGLGNVAQSVQKAYADAS